MDNVDNSTWRKASYSGNSGNCVEAADAEGSVVVRDSNDRDGLVLAVSAGAWAKFTSKLKLGSAAREVDSHEQSLLVAVGMSGVVPSHWL
jgi:hypothetical protein